ncbi:hypothetical protein [Bosea sp. RAC05]|uniref:hypothetical protein n=1 Tax=Bosea sp. RAC05 TaxID=1842539 RepID=UPI00085638FA|nr:hypothetical protein [Bosea sp. RAC05]AOG03313.1 hypothetical protein BSY19_4898 [Bosea sp. RAC05]
MNAVSFLPNPSDAAVPVRFADTSPHSPAVDLLIGNLEASERDATWIGCPGDDDEPKPVRLFWDGPAGTALLTLVVALSFVGGVEWFLQARQSGSLLQEGWILLGALAIPVIGVPGFAYWVTRKLTKQLDEEERQSRASRAFAIMPDGIAMASIRGDGTRILHTVPWEAVDSVTWFVNDGVTEKIRFGTVDGRIVWDLPCAVEGQPDAGACIAACSDHAPVCFVIVTSPDGAGKQHAHSA